MIFETQHFDLFRCKPMADQVISGHMVDQQSVAALFDVFGALVIEALQVSLNSKDELVTHPFRKALLKLALFQQESSLSTEREWLQDVLEESAR